MLKRAQQFPVFSPITGKQIGVLPRQLVHRQGNWHKGVQANIIRLNNDSFEILVQRRSHKVDIGRGKLDQSLATQMLVEDGNDEFATLQRGLRQELGISQFKALPLRANLKISKRYAEDPSLTNNELLYLYIVSITQEPRARSSKITELFWMDWAEYLALNLAHPELFTKTESFYSRVSLVSKEIDRLSRELLGLPADKCSLIPPELTINYVNGLDNRAFIKYVKKGEYGTT